MSDTRHVSDFYLQLDGADAPVQMMRDVLSISVESSMHLPDVATIVLNDQRLKWVDDSALEVGKKLVVKVKDVRTTETIFDGEIVEIEPGFEAGGLHVMIRAFDRLHRLARGRQSRTFLNVTDGDIIQKVAQEAGLRAKVGSTTQVHDYIIQWNQTNLEFLQERARALGYLLYVDGETLHCESPESRASAVELEWARDLVTFRPRLSTIGQVSSVSVRGWDAKTKKEVIGQASNGTTRPQIGVQKSGGQTAQTAFNIQAREQVSDRAISVQAQADTLAQAIMNEREARFIEAEGTASGNPKIVAGAKVKIGNVGTRFSGTYMVTGATHHYDADGYTTEFSVSGMRPATLLSFLMPETSASASTSRLALDGMLIGIVTDNQDPDNLGRVKVTFPSLSAEHASHWARVISVGGGPQRGIEFIPEVNDEVVVVFEQGDVSRPYVVGGLWNGKDAPPVPSNTAVQGGKVVQRVIKTRAGHVITLDDSDDKPSITIQDKSNNIIKLDSKTNELTIKVKGDGRISADGNLTIESKGTLTITSQQAASIEGKTGLELKSNTNATLQANANLELKSNGAATVQSNATLDVKSAAILTIQGTLVKIN